MEEKLVKNHITEAKELIQELEKEITLLNGSIENFLKRIYGDKWEEVKEQLEKAEQSEIAFTKPEN